ncbi:hypothetical protein BLNAU_13817 [Blattamonas nauphoetae]|uniref:Uncharacterized protein n=1 Tax=Blattamonas nauphoetae TaxID=2049346 RepID=A0ABQ9XFF5_9EUKA|nr:hypothetical protein BLNAU_13817 [Blattamonas nauphoetae]
MGDDQEKPEHSGPLAYFLFPHTDGDVTVDSSFFDHAYCGREKLPCSSLSHGWSQLKDSSAVVLSDATSLYTTTLSTSLTTAQTWQELKSNIHVFLIAVNDSGSFIVSAGTSLSLSMLDFSWVDMSSSSSSFISLASTASLSVTSCSFTEFSSSASGSVLSGSVGEDCFVEFESTRFKSCSSTNEKGSGVLDIALLSETSSFLLSSSSSFDYCVSTGITAQILLLSHPTLSTSVIENSIQSFWYQTDWSATEYVGKEGSFLPLVPLYLYFTAMESTGYLDPEWSDMSVAGAPISESGYRGP